MLKNANHLKGLVIQARDGEIGTVDQLYFDDESWAIRYLTVKTGGWLEDREVLISPFSVTNLDWPAKRLDVALTKKQVENSPSIDTQRPVSRQYETEYLGYYGYGNYWGGPYLWGPGDYPSSLTNRIATPEEALAERIRRASMDSHLRSSAAMTGYHIEAEDGEIGHVAGFVMDDETWAIRYIEVATHNLWPGKKVLFSPAWIQKVSWVDSKVYVGLYRDAIQTAPLFVDSVPLTREYEDRLYRHYGRPPYWVHEDERKPVFS
ncbi:MAG: PRC-barrel domain-containing protein [Candidatus Sulfotelmatobacter sp.]|jgi:hypothetical protein